MPFGVDRLIARLQAPGVPTCVASSGTHARMAHTLGLTGLHEHFTDRIYSATDVAHGKPAPDLFTSMADLADVLLRGSSGPTAPPRSGP